MSCMLPQFKCSPDTFAVNSKSRSHSSTHSSKSREPINFRTQWILSVALASTVRATFTVLEFEKLQLSPLEDIPNTVPADRSWRAASTVKTAMLDLEKLPSLDAHPIPIVSDKPLIHVGAVFLPSEINGTNLDKENLLTSEEGVITAAAEALAFSMAAVRIAKDAAMMIVHSKSTISSSNTTGILPEVVDNSIFEKSEPGHLAERDIVRRLSSLKWGWSKIIQLLIPLQNRMMWNLVLRNFLDAQLSMSIAVRSKHQTERKARRTRSAEKGASNIVSVNYGSSSRKKISSIQHVDYSDPLHYLRGTTSSSRLLTASEEHALLEGIQVLLKREKLQEEHIQRCGGQPTCAQWVASAGIDQKP